MVAKNLSPIQKLFGDAYSGKCQKRYRHKKDYTFYREGKELACLKLDYKISLEELSKWAKEIGADKCVITWTAMEGYCNKEVPLCTS